MRTRPLGLVSICVAAGVLAAAATWLLMSGGDAQDPATAASAPVASVSTGAVAEAPARDGVLRGGIGVRGHWTIEVRNPDGTLDRREEFDNALVKSGKILAFLLTTHRHLREWRVWLMTGTDKYLALEEAGPSGKEEGSQYLHVAYSLKPELVLPTDGTDHFVRLTGKVNAIEDAQISEVKTYLSVCSDAACVESAAGHDLTLHALPQPISVLNGQQVFVTIEFRFETAS